MNTNISSSSIEKNILSVERVIDCIKEADKKLNENYKKLYNQWKDDKYEKLGVLVRDCHSSLKSTKNELQKTKVKLLEILKYVKEYENTNLIVDSRSLGFSGSNYSCSEENGMMSGNIKKKLKNVEYRAITLATFHRTEQQIIDNISGGDMTEGSCSSLAFAYVGNKAGYVVYDFRDGQSREVFSSRTTIEQIANIDGINSINLRGTDDTLCAEQLMGNMEPGKEYYMATGSHAAIVRLNSNGQYQYLELQSGNSNENGWHPLTLSALELRFGCEDNQSNEYSNYLIELDSLQNNSEFLNLLGYINTDENSQMRGVNGHVR